MKRRFFAIEHGFQDCVKRLERNADLDHDVDNPSFGANALLILERVALQHGKEVVDRENKLREGYTGGKRAETLDDGLVGKGLAVSGGIFVDAFEEVLPSCTDIGWITMVCSLVNKEADVEVAGSFGVDVEELKQWRLD